MTTYVRFYMYACVSVKTYLRPVPGLIV